MITDFADTGEARCFSQVVLVSIVNGDALRLSDIPTSYSVHRSIVNQAFINDVNNDVDKTLPVGVMFGVSFPINTSFDVVSAFLAPDPPANTEKLNNDANNEYVELHLTDVENVLYIITKSLYDEIVQDCV
ncbi:MAG: hypothetical protein GKR92_05355 [Gammaproteobacteria bacterium]|nr:MAG: hypothetical protein GKR92_05355 [Gammaproteobacteria bacterium]